MPPLYILSFDIEDWFHYLDHPETRYEQQWQQFDSRIMANLERILVFLERKKQPATFFILGWLAKKHPEIVKMIVGGGHEVGLHSYGHQIVPAISHDGFREDLRKNIDILEHLTTEKISCYRAPGFSFNKDTPWMVEILAENGIAADASIAVAKLPHGGYPGFPQCAPCRIAFNGSMIKEFPVPSLQLGILKLLLTGGGYFRAWPYPVIRRYSLKSRYVMSYFHPHDFDPRRPGMKKLSLERKFRSHIGLTNALDKLERWLEEFPFTDLRTADSRIDWEKAPVVHLQG